MRVLIVEDFEELAQTIAAGLRREGMAVDVVLDGHAALQHTSLSAYDVVVLDRDLPGHVSSHPRGGLIVVVTLMA